MNLLQKTFALATLALCLSPLNSNAITITFNGTAAEGTDLPWSDPTYSEGGYILTKVGNGGAAYFYDNDTPGFPGLASFDDDVLGFREDTVDGFVVTQVGGGSFDLFSVRTGSLARPGRPGDEGMFTFTGTFADGSGTISVNVPGLESPSTTLFAGFTNLSSFKVTSTDGFFPVLDDLVVSTPTTSVPDGGSAIALLGFALSAVAGARRKFGI